ncbi:MAG: CCA tRNA nucleotidyltransferase [Armatimonadota bacterium]
MSEQHIEDILARIPRSEDLLAAKASLHVPAWIVGGVVRDLLFDRLPLDVDITTQYPEPLARRFAEIVGGHVVPMDEERGIWRIAISGLQYFDFCRFRDGDIIGDLHGRDFTINAIALALPGNGDPGGALDPFHGIDDLNAGVLRMVSPRAFRDDPVRVLRAFRFLSGLNLTIEDDTWEALREQVPNLTEPAPERLLAEWWKLCAGANAARAIARMDEAGALDRLFPELRETKGVTQNVYHHLDVFEHQMLATAHMDHFLQHPAEILQDLEPFFAPVITDDHRRARLVFLALIHDIGKAATRTIEHGKVHFYGHEVSGAEMASVLCRRLRMSRDDTQAIGRIIHHHLRPLFLTQASERGTLSRKAMIKFFDAVGQYALEVMLLAMADKSAARGPASEPDILDRLRDIYRQLLAFYQDEYAPVLANPLITGHDLIDDAGLTPGPELGRLLYRARELQMEGKLKTRADALRWAATCRPSGSR